MMKKKNTILNTVMLVTGIIVLINILSDRFFVRLDLTNDKMYTLDDATRDILKNLEEPVTITAYFTKKLPPQVSRLRTEFKNKLDEFVNVSKGKVVYEFISPDDDETKQEAQKNGVVEVEIGQRSENEASSQLAYLGAVIKMGTEQEVLPVIQSETGMEYDLAKAIKKLSNTEKPRLALLQGHGEAGVQKLQHVYYELSSFYTIQTVFLNDTGNMLNDYNTALIIAPTDTFPTHHLAQLSNFIESGKNVFIALNTVGMDQTSQYGQPVNTNLADWLQQYGLTINSDYVVDASAPRQVLQMQVAPGQMQIVPVTFFYFPTIINFEDNPVTGGIEQITFQLISSISYNGDKPENFMPLMKTSEKSGTKSNYYIQELMRKWSEDDFPMKELTVGASLEVDNANGSTSKIILIGDGDFALGNERSPQIAPDNVNLLANSVDWLSDDTGLVGLRTKGATSRPIEEMEEGKELTLKIINLAIPLLLIIIIGIVIRVKNKNLQNKRREEGYV